MTGGQSEAKPLSRFSLTALVVASMVGAGVYTTSGFALADLHSPWLVLAAWLTGGLIAICGAVGYGQLAARLTESGGEYLFLSRLVHPAAGFVAGWISMLAGFTGAGAFAAGVFESYALPESLRPTWIPHGSLAVGLVVAATLAHAFNTRRGAASQNVVVALKLGLLVLFILWAFTMRAHWQGVAQSTIVASASAVTPFVFATSVMWISLSYSGFNAAVYVASEARGGARDIAGAMIGGTLIVTVLYLALNTVFVFGPKAETIAGQEDVAAIAAQSIGGTALSMTVRIAVCLGLASSVFSVLMAGPRVYAKMAADGWFPRFLDSRRSPPTRAVLLQGIAIILVVSFVELQTLLSYLGMTLALSAAATVSTVFYVAQPVRGVNDTPGRWMRYAAYPVAPAIYVTATVVIAALAAWNRPLEAIVAVATIVIGAAIYAAVQGLRRT